MAFSMEPKRFKKNARSMQRSWKRRMETISDYDVDDFLRVFGLRRQPKGMSRFMSGFGLVLGGVALGVGLGMMMAPKRKEMMRSFGMHTQGHHPPHQHQQHHGERQQRPL